MARLAAWSVVFCGCLAATAARGQLTVYDDALQNGFANWSWPGPSHVDLAAASPVHAGAAAIRFLPEDWSGLSIHGVYDQNAYGAIELWVHGGGAGEQDLRVAMTLDDGTLVGAWAELNPFVEQGAIAAGDWRKVTVPFDAPALGIGGNPFTRVTLMGVVESQAAIYFDDVRLVPAGAGPPPGDGLLQIERDVPVGPVTPKLSDRFSWRDSAGEQRSAAIAQNYGGALREMVYEANGATRTCGVTGYGNGNNGGFGYVVSHRREGSAGIAGDDSPLGYAFPGTFTRVFEGANHAIFRFTQSYPRHSSTTADPANTQYQVPVTIEWTFAVGRDHPLWSVTWDLSAVPADALDDDSRAPYGELNIDGTGAANISGVAWGDRYRFTSTTAPVTLSSEWDWTAPNTVPWVKLWIASTDATMGLVQTQTLAQHDAGAGRNQWWHDLRPHWGTTSADGNAGGAYEMPWQDSWPYQANSFSIGVGVANNNARLTWGTMYGFLGQQSYATGNGLVDDAAGWPKQSYSTHVVMGTHTDGPVEAVVAEVETLQTLTLSATVGSVATGGPRGVADTAVATYSPPGYDPVRGALTFVAAGNALDANVAVGAGRTLSNPLVIVRGFTAAAVPAIRFAGVALVPDVDVFVSLRDAADELWLTLDRDLAGATNRLEVLAGPAGPAPVTVAVDPQAGRRPIDPRVYGVNFGPFGPDVPPYPVRRWGGNWSSRYNWQTDVANHAADWFFYSYKEGPPGGSAADEFVASTFASGAEPLITIPTIGWKPRNDLDMTTPGSVRWSFSRDKYDVGGKVQTHDECLATGGVFWCQQDAANGVYAAGPPPEYVPNDPFDVSEPSWPADATAWLDHLAAERGGATAGDPGGVRLFALDNEMMLWHDTHRDVRFANEPPYAALQPPGYDELWERTLLYGEALAAHDPEVQVFGPVTWGFCDLFWSARDGCGEGADHAAHGGEDLLPWYLGQLADYASANGGDRLVDWLDLHYYPQVEDVALSWDESPAVAAKRLDSLQSLWHDTYQEDSWIGRPGDLNRPVRYLPRIREWLQQAGLADMPVAITEYNWGDGDSDGNPANGTDMNGMSSALAQAEVLALFGREGVDLATRWGAPLPGSRIEDAFRMFLDWDTTDTPGMPRIDGETAAAVSSDPGRVGAYAIVGTGDDAGRLFLLLFNKSTVAEAVNATFPAGTLDGAAAPTFRLAAAGYDGVTDTVPAGDSVALTLPARTATLVVLASAGEPPPPPGGLSFYTVTPCRLVDTRSLPGPRGGPALAAGTVRTFALGGAPCGIPPSARALSLNLTATQPTGPGNVAAWAADRPKPGTSAINFAAGQTRANNAVLSVSADGEVELSVVATVIGGGTVHFVLDVNGYFE